jgi:hypothetical protein
MTRLRAFLDRLPGGHRPPTGPLTTDEASEAEALRQEAEAEALLEARPIEPGPEEESDQQST